MEKMPKNCRLLENARTLRREMTPQERKVWYLFLKDYPVKIYKQRIIGEYIVDFYCSSAKLVIELDGSQHFDEAGMRYDQNRTKYLRSLGLEVVRYSNADVNERFRDVCDSIDYLIRTRRGDPLSHG